MILPQAGVVLPRAAPAAPLRTGHGDKMMHLTKRIIQMDDKGTKLKLEFDLGNDEPLTLSLAVAEAAKYLTRHFEAQMAIDFEATQGELEEVTDE